MKRQCEAVFEVTPLEKKSNAVFKCYAYNESEKNLELCLEKKLVWKLLILEKINQTLLTRSVVCLIVTKNIQYTI